MEDSAEQGTPIATPKTKLANCTVDHVIVFAGRSLALLATFEAIIPTTWIEHEGVAIVGFSMMNKSNI